MRKEELKSADLITKFSLSKEQNAALESRNRALEQRVRELELESRDKDLERESLKKELKDLQAGNTSQSSEGCFVEALLWFVCCDKKQSVGAAC